MKSTATSGPQTESHKPLSVTTVIVVICLVSLVAGLSIQYINDYSDQERVIETSLAETKASAFQLNAIEDTVIAEGRTKAPVRSDISAGASKIAQSLSVVRGSRSSAPAASKVDILLKEYLTAVDKELELVDQGRKIEAQKVATTQADPAFARLTGSIVLSQRAAKHSAEKANFVVDLATLGVLAIAALMMSLIIRQFQLAQVRNARLVTEHDVLARSEDRFHSLIRSASDAILIVNRAGDITYASSAVTRLWGYEQSQLVGTQLSHIVHADELSRARTLFTQVQTTDCPLTAELQIQNRGGEFRSTEVVVTNLLNQENVDGMVLNCRDITERKSFEQQLAHQAFHDTLTGLPNRALFNERLTHALMRSKRSHSTVGVLFLDLDNFKFINDSLGHEAGDSLLKSVASRLATCVREADTVARLGGDEFTVLIDDAQNNEQVYGLAERIIEVLKAPIQVAGREAFIGCSIGIAISQDDTCIADELLRDADTAMYQAKSGGKSQSVVFDRSMNTQVVERMELETDMRKALVNHEFIVHYQPIVEIETGRIAEVEALVRWSHPTRGMLSPAKFIPIAEDTGMIVPLGLIVLKTACSQVKAWQTQYPASPPLTVSVNLSARQLQRENIVSEVLDVLKSTGLPASQLKLEITESVMVLEPEATIPKLNQFTQHGIRLAVDDFGTGYSSMSYLSSMPIDTLKIDRSFVSKIGAHKEDEAIIRAIVTLAKTLNLSITSEGIETEEQRSHLEDLGCEMGQGYLYAKPTGAAEVAELLAWQNQGASHAIDGYRLPINRILNGLQKAA